MPDQQQTEPHPLKGAPRGKRLDGLSPVQREQVAAWLESKVAKLPQLIAQSQVWLNSHPGDYATQGQIHYWRAALAAARWFASLARSEKVRDNAP